eukprot:m.87402 g.87402  ORF g.87402 m.87402 type:complete len:362 (-) comp26067_c0_seq1:28-1113(-)
MFQPNNQQPAPDPMLANPPADSVQCIEWSPTANYIASGSWDNEMRVWEVQNQGQQVHSQVKADSAQKQNKHTGAVFDLSWDNTGSKVFSASADKTVKMWDLNTQQFTQIGVHDQPVKTCHFIPSLNVVMTGSWDKTLKFWDTRSPTPAVVKQMPERVYCADVVDDIAVACTADMKVSVYQLSKGVADYRQITSTMKMQIRCISAFKPEQQANPNTTQASYGFALGSIEGRVSIQYIEPNMESKHNFAFKCHRESNNNVSNIHVVNSIDFHPRHHTFATCGSDGRFVFWDKDSKQRLKAFEKLAAPAPITCGRFNADGNLFAYAFSYDWGKGSQQFQKYNTTQICVHSTLDGSECKKKTTKK